VIMVASRTYFLANPGQMAYVASKGAVMGMTRVLAKEMGEQGIPVNAVMPGMVATPGTTEHSQEEAFNRVMGNQAIKKRVQPEHLAGLIAFPGQRRRGTDHRPDDSLRWRRLSPLP
jgi:NAD(P)-dependent dehydrogenase (short-subunit alcohol dehydrogenase family)